jgi:hypothetical protein
MDDSRWSVKRKRAERRKCHDALTLQCSALRTPGKPGLLASRPRQRTRFCASPYCTLPVAAHSQPR